MDEDLDHQCDCEYCPMGAQTREREELAAALIAWRCLLNRRGWVKAADYQGLINRHHTAIYCG